MEEIESMSEQQTTSAIADDLKLFLSGCKDKDGEYKYFNSINDLMAANSTHITVDFLDFNEDISKMFLDNADEVVNALNMAAFAILKDIHPDYAQEVENKIRVRIINYPIVRGLREINAEVVNKMISVSGIIVRASEVKPYIKKACFKCIECSVLNEGKINGLVLKKPIICNDCGGKNLELDPEKSLFINFQFVRIQELPEDLPAGQLPHYVEVTVVDDLVDQCRPGDRVLLTGVVRIDQEEGQQQTLFKLRMECNNIEYLGTLSDGDRSYERVSITDEDEKRILEIAGTKDVYDKLIGSFAPHIYGHEMIKESILLLIVGSVTKKLSDGSNRRGDINIFLVGDPGTAKSEMLKFAAKIAPRGMYTSGRGTTAAGLTAAVIHDKSGIMVLESGAVVLGDQGIVCIDEFDKIKSEDRSALHEVMEQQTCSVAKGGIVATLNARTSILSAANPKYGKYDPTRNIYENVEPLPIPLLTRFDIIHILRDTSNAERDKNIARHILQIHKDTNKSKPAIEIDLFQKYLTYAKRKEPELTDEAISVIQNYYLKMRGIGSDEMITTTPRQLEGIVRLATARAKLLLKDKVDKDDAERAILLLSKSLETVGIDVNTGKVDLGVLHGKPLSQTSKLKTFSDVFNGLTIDGSVSEKDFVTELIRTGKFTDDEAKEFIRKAMMQGQIYEVKFGHYAKV